MPNEEATQKAKRKHFTLYWIIVVIATIIIGITLPIFQNVPLENAILYTIFFLIIEVIGYYIRIKPSIKINRIMYILMGAPIGFVLWFLFMLYSIHAFGYWVNDNFVFVFGSLAVCFIVGALIGDLIGRLLHYKGPRQYQP